MKLRKLLSKSHKVLSHVNPATAVVEHLRHKYLPSKKIKGAIMRGITGKSSFNYSNSASGGYTPRTLAQLTTR